MRQKEEMYNEGNTGGGTGAARPEVESEKKGYAKFLFFAAVAVIIVAGVVIAVING